MIQVYTGNGKGKTTAAIGQAVRAKGRGLKVAVVYFHKDADKDKSGEIKMLKKIGIDVFSFAKKHPHFHKNASVGVIKKECRDAMDFIENVLFKKKYGLVVLDEACIALRDCFIEEEMFIGMLKSRPKNTEIILTGRGATKKIIELADLVSEIKEVKHYFRKGIKARKGIEY